MNSVIDATIGLLVAAILVALIAHRLRMPYTVGLVVAGIALAISPIRTHLALTHDVIFDVILPPLLFEAALNLRWQELRRDALPILALALLGTFIAAAFVTAVMMYGLGWPAKAALTFGVLIAATDPVSVIAMFKDNGVSGRLRLLVESESLLNDAAAAVLFSLALAWASGTGGGDMTLRLISQSAAVTVGGGLLSGILCGGVAILLAGRTVDYLVESTLTTVAAYGSFVLAEHFHGSGVLAVVVAGLVLGNLGIFAEGEGVPITQRGREFTLALWDFIAFIANSLVFLLIGLTVAGIPFGTLGFKALAFAVAAVLAGRALTVYPVCAAFRWSRWRIAGRCQHVLWWGGLRGALGLALALSLDAAFPMRDQIVVATFGVVVFSVVVQGLTIPLLLPKSGDKLH